MSASRTIDRIFFATCIAAIALFLGAYANSLHNGFHFDDDHVIERNLHLRDLRNLPRFFTDASTFSTLTQNATYRPLVSVTLAIDYALGGGLNPVPFHVTQLLLFLGVGALLALVMSALLHCTGPAPWHRWAALFAAALFCLHTANTQPGNYLSARSELLSALGVLGAFALYLRAPKLRRFHLYLVPMALGALAKPPAVVFAPLLFLFHFLFEGGDARFSSRVWQALKVSAPALIVGAALFVFVERMNPPGQTYGGAGRAQYLWTQAFVWLRYARLFFWPSGLSADSDQGLLPTWMDARVFAGVALLLSTIALALWCARRPALRPIAFGLGWYWVGLLPTSIVPLAEVTNDHRMFLGYLGAAIAVGAAVFQLSAPLLERRRWAVPALSAALVGVLGAHAVGTHVRNRVWLNEETLWADVVKKSPGNGRGWMNYGLTQMRKGELAYAKSLFEHALTLTPNYAVLEVNLGIVTGALGDRVEAERHFLRAKSLAPQYSGAYAFYARFLAEVGRAPQAIAELDRALALQPADAFARKQLLGLLAARGEPDTVRAFASQTLSFGEDPEARARLEGRPPFSARGDSANDWYELGLELTRSNKHARAAEAYRAAIARDPSLADAWNNLGWSLGELGFVPEAEAALRRALELSPHHERARNNLRQLTGRR